MNRADTDTAYEAFIALKTSKSLKELEKANPGMPLPGRVKGEGRANTSAFGAPSNAKRKRSTDSLSDDDDDSRKSPAAMNGGIGTSSTSNGSNLAPDSTSMQNSMMPNLGQWDFLFPDPELASVAGPGPSAWHAHTAGVDSATHGRAMGQFAQPPPGAGPTPMGSHHDGEARTPDQERQRNLRNAVAHMTSGAMPNSPSMILTSSNNMTSAQVEERKRLQEELRQSMEGDEAAERKTEALQLITYHLNK
jgi:hypothetical protein